MPPSTSLAELRGLVQLACESTIGVTDVVEQMHGTIRTLPLPLGTPRRQPNAGFARLVYGSIRGTTRIVNWTVRTTTSPWHSTDTQSEARERGALVAALNGVAGDHLARTENPLATAMRLRPAGDAEVAGKRRPRRWLVLVHGMCMDDRQWLRRGHDHGAALARELGYTPLYLRYNSGLGLQENAQQFAGQLELFLAENGHEDDALTILGFSLGGLLTRRTIAQAQQSSHRWIEQLNRVVFLGTPHAGAPLASGGRQLDRALMISPYSAAFARLGLARSRGLHELHEGLGSDLSAIPDRVERFALAGSLSGAPSSAGDALLGDGLVSVASALAELPAKRGQESVPMHRELIRGVGHLGLLEHPAVFQQLLRWLS